MIDQVFKSFQSALATKGVVRALWTVLLAVVLVGAFETETNYFEIQSISSRLEAVNRASQSPLTTEQTAQIAVMKDGLIRELGGVQTKRTEPIRQFRVIAIRFAKGAWIMVIVVLVLFKLAVWMYKKVPKRDASTMVLALSFGWRALCFMTWAATMLGVISVFFNTGDGVIISWIVFPVCSLVVTAVVVFWIVLLRSLLPAENTDARAQTPVSGNADRA